MVRSEADKYEVSSWDEYPIMFMCTPVEFQVDPTNNVPVAQKKDMMTEIPQFVA